MFIPLFSGSAPSRPKSFQQDLSAQENDYLQFALAESRADQISLGNSVLSTPPGDTYSRRSVSSSRSSLLIPGAYQENALPRRRSLEALEVKNAKAPSLAESNQSNRSRRSNSRNHSPARRSSPDTTSYAIAGPSRLAPTPGKMKQNGVEQLFPGNLSSIKIKQKPVGNTCYLLSSFDSILHHPNARQILSRIQINEIQKKGILGLGQQIDYEVKFPGQAQTVLVSASELRKSTVDTESRGIKILERAFFKLSGTQLGKFDESVRALTKIFGEDLLPINIQNGRNALRRQEVKVKFSRWNNSFSISDSNVKISETDIIAQNRPEFLAQLNLARAGQPYKLRLERLDARAVGQPPYQLLQPDHFIGNRGFFHEDRKLELQKLIEEAHSATRSTKPFHSDIMTAIHIGGGHYYSVRLDESTPMHIELMDPFHPKVVIVVSIDDFLKYYNLEGVRLPA